ncbi:hypothetical protein GGH19_000791 [Coemansia sp. RSA 1807]|nr:hypothetical protein GGF48_000197 [Coemansia sp. RSA 921]KAJ2578073.1 hypothetical protein GGH19_000791 [Coemansia sp. RSA 1807]KAJ2652401.1 hypothetical protein IW137_000313 [Coemansia sp. RSA 1287]
MLSVHAADPEQGLNLALSAVVGYVSLVCWMVVMFPQIYMNYQRKSGEGVSLVMMIAWVCGDIFNITGALMQGLVSSTVLIGSYYLFVDSTLLYQIVYYRLVYQAHRPKDSCEDEQSRLTAAADNSNDDGLARAADRASVRDARGQSGSQLQTVLSLLLSLSAMAILVVLVVALVAGTGSAELPTPGDGAKTSPLPLSQVIAQAMGTASATVYIMSYVPQAVQNYQRKSCEGLSIWLFLLSLLGNTTYALAILVVSLDPHYLAPYVPWLMGALVPCVIQMFILYQFHTYPH